MHFFASPCSWKSSGMFNIQICDPPYSSLISLNGESVHDGRTSWDLTIQCWRTTLIWWHSRRWHLVGHSFLKCILRRSSQLKRRELHIYLNGIWFFMDICIFLWIHCLAYVHQHILFVLVLHSIHVLLFLINPEVVCDLGVVVFHPGSSIIQGFSVALRWNISVSGTETHIVYPSVRKKFKNETWGIQKNTSSRGKR